MPALLRTARRRGLGHFLGPDEKGVPLEVMAIDLAEDDLLVIHAMKMRRKYLDDYRRVMECQGQ